MEEVTIESNVKNPERVKSRRAQIVAAAVRLFIEKGFHRTTTREIARESGLSTGAVYEYVKSKEDILYLVCRHIHTEMEQGLLAGLPTDADGATRLECAIGAFLDVIHEMQEEVLLIYQESKSLPHDFLSEVLAKEMEIAHFFEQLLRDGMADGTLRADPSAVQVLAHQIVVGGQMWAFRRWALKNVSFEQFRKLQITHLMQACGRVDKCEREENVHA